MKVFKARPQTELRVRKPDSNIDIYEMWHVQPKCLGTVEKLGNRNYRSDDGMTFANLDDVGRYMAGRAEKDYSQVEKKPVTRPAIKGFEIIEAGTWIKFCKMKNIDSRDTAAMHKEYHLTQQEMLELRIVR